MTRKTKASRIIRYISDGILPLLFWILIIFAFDSPDIAILTILSALIHELGHITAILFRNVRFALRGHLSGFRISEGSSSYTDHLIILAGGPIANVLVYLASLLFSDTLGGYISLFGYINLITAISNLIPIEGYDGYGILYNLFLRFEIRIGERILSSLSFLVSISLAFLALYLLSRYDVGYWIYGLFFTLILIKIKENSKLS